MISKGNGLTPSEKFLKLLCESTFLSMWSYPNVYRQSGSELCDLLVVTGDDIIIFSDKHCQFPRTNNLEQDWNRWFRRAVCKSAKQLWGAQKWIINHTSRIFLDSKCEVPYPLPIVINKKTKFHLILVAHGASERCRDELGGSGSMMFDNQFKGISNHNLPFTIGDLEPNETFIHVLDDFTLDIVLRTRDTITDFVQYLTKKEQLVRSGLHIFSAGEEEMMAFYLKEVNENNEHDFVISKTEEPLRGVAFLEGMWEDFKNNPQRLAQIEANKISYAWDGLIEEFSKHALAGTQYHVSEGGFIDSEYAIRFLALEPRFTRRILAKSLKDMILSTPKHLRRLRVWSGDEAIYHLFLLLPFNFEYTDKNYEDYRYVRRQFLEISCLVTRLTFPNAKYVVGIAMESGINLNRHSEDLIVFDCSQWDEEIEKQAREDQIKFRILVSPKHLTSNEKEYPDH